MTISVQTALSAVTGIEDVIAVYHLHLYMKQPPAGPSYVVTSKGGGGGAKPLSKPLLKASLTISNDLDDTINPDFGGNLDIEIILRQGCFLYSWAAVREIDHVDR